MSFIVIRWPCDSYHIPTKEHETQNEAVIEAERLARKHPDYAFRVAEFKTKTTADVSVMTTLLMDGAQ